MVERTFQEHIVQDELYPKRNLHLRFEKKQMTLIQFVWDKAKGYLRVFLETSSIHGLNHLVTFGRHPCEVLLWLTVVALSVFGSIYLSGTTWLRYQFSPTVVSMDRDMFAWNTTFPCVTICPERKVDPKKLKIYLKNSDEPDKEKLSAFLLALANGTFQNFDAIPEYDRIPSTQFMETILNLSINFNPTLTIGASGISLFLQPTIMEMGLCYAINSRIAVYNDPAYRAADRWDILKKHNDTFFVHPLDGEVFAQVINLSTPYDVYIHGPLEVPDIATKHQHSAEDFYMKVYVTALTVYTAPDAVKLSVPQRRCRFADENTLLHNSVYSYNMCRMECRIRLSLQYCGCVPHFYRIRKVLFNLEDENHRKINCDCLPICDDVNYVLQSYALQEWFLGTNLQWGIMTYPRMRYRRDIIFGFTDVLVAVGSMAGLFLGCSVLSFMEIIYFLTLRLFWYIFGALKR